MSSSENATIAVPAGDDGFDGDDFANNLFSDLAPLLTLFGEQVTKQFISMSMGWADTILLSLGPLGILTILVSVIRVSGVPQLMSLIGRGRETKRVAERELLSSTSDEVCELWNESEIVREFGKPPGLNCVLVKSMSPPDLHTTNKKDASVSSSHDPEKEEVRPLILKNPLPKNIRSCLTKKPSILRSHYFSHNQKLHPILQKLKKLGRSSNNQGNDQQVEVEQASLKESKISNLSLIRHSPTAPWEPWAWVVLGVCLQVVAFIIPALVTYRWQWLKNGKKIPLYSYPSYLMGSLSMMTGILLGGYVIDDSSIEKIYYINKNNFSSKFGDTAVWIQRACTINDQDFPSCLIFNPDDDTVIRFSHLNDENHEKRYQSRKHRVLTVISTILIVIGYITQFVGLRGLHWTAAIFQLGVTVIMTAIRSFLRRGLSRSLVSTTLPEPEFELASLALYSVYKNKSSPRLDHPKKLGLEPDADALPIWEIRTLRGEYWENHSPSSKFSSVLGTIDDHYARLWSVYHDYHILFTSGSWCIGPKPSFRGDLEEHSVLIMLHHLEDEVQNFKNIIIESLGSRLQYVICQVLYWIHNSYAFCSFNIDPKYLLHPMIIFRWQINIFRTPRGGPTSADAEPSKVFLLFCLEEDAYKLLFGGPDFKDIIQLWMVTLLQRLKFYESINLGVLAATDSSKIVRRICRIYGDESVSKVLSEQVWDPDETRIQRIAKPGTFSSYHVIFGAYWLETFEEKQHQHADTLIHLMNVDEVTESLETECILELFALFLLAIAPNIKLKQPPYITTNQTNGKRYLRHPIVDYIVDHAMQSHLSRDRSKILKIVVGVFLKCNVISNETISSFESKSARSNPKWRDATPHKILQLARRENQKDLLESDLETSSDEFDQENDDWELDQLFSDEYDFAWFH